MSSPDDDLIEIGHILAAHGVKGQVKVYSNTSPRENIVTYSPWVLEQAGEQKTVEVTGKRQGKNVIAQLAGIDDRDQAIGLSGARILIRSEQLPQLEQGEFYWSQLIGLDVVSTEDQAFGRVDHMLETGANDVMVVQGDRERLIPFVMDEVVKQVDLDQGQIIVEWDAEF
ncbi:MAG: ribosome maturation factor RimM [Gammaproteobacteria bacterium]|nr:ribosome maturation factor RimM [Gammaproteobacteria bacterium]